MPLLLPLLSAASAYVLQPQPVPHTDACLRVRAAAPIMKDFPKPKQLENTDPYREANALSAKFGAANWKIAEAGKKEKIAIIGQTREPLRYDLPDELIGKLWGGLYRGQEQHWFLARFEGTDDDVDLEAHETPEFCEFRWVPASTLPDLIVPFKKRVYRAIVTEFADLI